MRQLGVITGGSPDPQGSVQISVTLIKSTSSSVLYDVYIRLASSLKWIGCLHGEDTTSYAKIDALVRATWDNIPERISYRVIQYTEPIIRVVSLT